MKENLLLLKNLLGLTVKNKIYKHRTAVSKSVYFHVLDDLFKNYNNAYHDTIKMKPVDVKSDS